ncbi:MAG: EamA family transporter, partial [Paracoccaceae bacterium]|nr:EamA family transporter [Paracoccaceae bacterium]
GVSVLWVVLAGFHAITTGQDLSLQKEIWPFVATSVLGLTLYYYGTLSALRRGNLSIYYPIIRSSPIAIVVYSWLVMDQNYSWFTVVGIFTILLGSLMLQKTTGNFLQDQKAFGLAIIAMLGSAAYSISDAGAMQITTPAVFLFYTNISVTLLLLGIQRWESRLDAMSLLDVLQQWMKAPWRIVLAGVSSYLSYLFILMAFQLGAEAAAVSAVRQASIPVSIILAAIILLEPRFFKNIAWASLIALGILFITFSAI